MEVCVYITVHVRWGGVLLDGMRSLHTQLWAQAGSWNLVPPQQRQVDTATHLLRLVTAHRGQAQEGWVQQSPSKWEGKAAETSRGVSLGWKQEWHGTMGSIA